MTKSTTKAAEMKRTWLVQRLKKPYSGSSILGVDNPFSFGGGLRNGGLSDDAMQLIRGLFSFDYMGAAEFEFGAVPEALREIASHGKKLTAFVITLPLSEVPAPWRTPKNAPVPTGEAELYVLSRADHADEVAGRINDWARGKEQLKEATRLANALRPVDDWDCDVQGWLELNNGFFFFTSLDMWRGVCDLFGVDTSAVSS